MTIPRPEEYMRAFHNKINFTKVIDAKITSTPSPTDTPEKEEDGPRCYKEGCDNFLYKGDTYEFDGKEYCSPEHTPKEVGVTIEPWQTTYLRTREEVETAGTYDRGDGYMEAMPEPIPEEWEKKLEDLIHECYVIIDSHGNGFDDVQGFIRSLLSQAKAEGRKEMAEGVEKEFTLANFVGCPNSAESMIKLAKEKVLALLADNK